MTLRTVSKVLTRPPAHWVGDGFRVYPVFANKAFTEELSPLLMFDYAAPKEFPAHQEKPRGVGQHPHRGFETVTIAFQGEVEHHDSTGKSGIIHPGDVQWMTAGRGIIHQEYHSKEFTATGGTFEMCQLWVNLPKNKKMTKPGYQAISAKDIPTVPLPLGATEEATASARIVAGELGGTKGPAKTHSPVQLWDLKLSSKTPVDVPFPAEHNCIVFARSGSVKILGNDDKELKTLNPQDVAIMALDGSNTLRLQSNKGDSSVLILGGEPLNEPIAAQGPFVMNTRQELQQAMSDYHSGKMGR